MNFVALYRLTLRAPVASYRFSDLLTSSRGRGAISTQGLPPPHPSQGGQPRGARPQDWQFDGLSDFGFVLAAIVRKVSRVARSTLTKENTRTKPT